MCYESFSDATTLCIKLGLATLGCVTFCRMFLRQSSLEKSPAEFLGRFVANNVRLCNFPTTQQLETRVLPSS